MKILDNGPDKDRVVLVFFADGFTAVRESAFYEYCRQKINYAMSLEPMKSIAYKYNAYAFFNPSQDAGINHPNLLGSGCYGQPALSVNTYFGCSFDSMINGQRIHRVISPKDTGLVYAEMSKQLPASTAKNNYLPVILCDSQFEGGQAIGSMGVFTLSPNSNNTFIHETFGHALAGLGDEFASGANAEAWNCSKESDPTKVRWKAFIPPAGIVKVNAAGWGVPTASCKMGQDLTKDFCVVCANQIKLATDQLIRLSGGVPPTGPTTPVPPAITAPNLVLGNVLNNSIQIKWNQQKADSYAFSIMPSGGAWKSAGTANGDATMRTFQNLKRKTTYEIKVVLFSGGVQYESTIKATTK